MQADEGVDPVTLASGFLHGRRHVGEELRERRHKDLIQQVFLARHVVVQRGLLDAPRGRDFTGGGGGEPFFPKQSGGGVQQPVDGGGGELRGPARLHPFKNACSSASVSLG